MSDEKVKRPKIKLISHSYSATIEDNFRGSGETELHYWCLERDSKPALVRLTKTPIYCYTAFPQFVKNKFTGKKERITWDSTLALRFYQIIFKMMDSKGNAPIESIFDKKRLLYYYKGDIKTPMIRFSFNTVSALRHYKNIINKPFRIDDMEDVILTIMEETVDPVLRLNTIKNLGYSQWFEVEAEEILIDDEDRISYDGGRDKINREYIADWKTIRPISKEESKGWNSNPRKATIDIECYTPNHNQMTDCDRHDNLVWLISIIFAQKGKPDEKYLISILPMNETKNKYCKHSLDDCEFILADDEEDLIIKFANLIKYLSPEIIDGWNIYGFDFNYLRKRMTKIGGIFPSMGRLLFEKEEFFVIKEWQSSGFGSNKICYPIAKGIICLDELQSVKRLFKYDKYTLDFCSKEILKNKDLEKHNISAKEMFVRYEQLNKTKKALKRFNDGKKSKKTKEQLEKDYLKALDDITEVGIYCLQDSILVNKIYTAINLWIDLVEMSNVAGVTVSDVTTKGQQVRSFSKIYNKAYRENVVINNRIMKKVHYSGGFVNDPDVGLKDNIITLDFAGLYPSIIIALNICYTTLIDPKDWDNVNENDYTPVIFYQEEPVDGVKTTRKDIDLDIPDDNAIEDDYDDDLEAEIEQNEEIDFENMTNEKYEDLFNKFFNFKKKKISKKKKVKTISVRHEYRFVKASVRKGILPMVCEELSAARKDANKELKKLKNTAENLSNIRKDIIDINKLNELELAIFKSEPEKYLYKYNKNIIDETKLNNEELNIYHNNPNELKIRKDMINQKKLSEDELKIFKNTPENILNSFNDTHIIKPNIYKEKLDKKYTDLVNKKNVLTSLYDNYNNIYKECVFSKEKIYNKEFINLIGLYNKDILNTINNNESKINFDLMDVSMNDYWLSKNNLINHINNINNCVENSNNDQLHILLKEKNIYLREYRDKVELLSQEAAKYIDINNKAYGFEDSRTVQYLKLKKSLGSIIEILKFSEVIDECEEKKKLINQNKDKADKLSNKISELEIILNYTKEENSVADVDNIEENKDLYELMSQLDQSIKELEKINIYLDNNKIEDVIELDYYESNIDKYLSLYDGQGGECNGKISDIDNELKLLKEQISTLIELIDSNNFMKDLHSKIKEILTSADVMNSYQLAIKMTNNSMYGFIGVQEGGKLPLIEGALSVTAYGRQSIEKVNNYAISKYNAKIVYNDTDSSMIDLGLKDPRDCEIWGNRLQREMSGTPEIKKRNGQIIPAVESQCNFPSPMKIEYEKGGRMFAIRKKKYVMYTLKSDGTFEIDNKGNKKILKRGITIARRDNCPYVRECYTELLTCIMERESIFKAFKIICDYVIRLLDDKIPFDKMIIIKGVGSNYASETAAMKVFSEELNSRGQIVQAGDRLSYVIVTPHNDPKCKTLGMKMREVLMYKNAIEREGDDYDPESEYPKEKLDYLYYILHNLMNPIDQIFNIAYREELKYCGLIHNNHGSSKANITTPVKFLASFIKAHMRNNLLDIETVYKRSVEDIKELPLMFENRYGRLKEEMLEYSRGVANYFEQVRINKMKLQAKNEENIKKEEKKKLIFKNKEEDIIEKKKKLVFKNKKEDVIENNVIEKKKLVFKKKEKTECQIKEKIKDTFTNTSGYIIKTL